MEFDDEQLAGLERVTRAVVGERLGVPAAAVDLDVVLDQAGAVRPDALERLTVRRVFGPPPTAGDLAAGDVDESLRTARSLFGGGR